MVNSGEREEGKGFPLKGDLKKGVIMGVHEIMCETFENCKALKE